MDDFESKISQLDTGLFKHVLSQSTENDKRSLLAVQLAIRQRKEFVYLEIGSYLGGSLQPYVADPRCRQIISIDPRPCALPDERGVTQRYVATTESMLDCLRDVPGTDLGKLHTIEAGTETILTGSLPSRPDLCFIDGEHTDVAVLRDSQFCLAALQGSGCITYHDANIVYNGIHSFIEILRQRAIPFRAMHLPDCIFLIELGEPVACDSKIIHAMQRESYSGYLWSLRENDGFRKFFNLPLFKFCRTVRMKTWDRVAGRLRKLFN